MKIKNQFLLKTIWKASGQLRHSSGNGSTSSGAAWIAPFKNAAPASATISSDFELCWAWRGLPEAAREERGETERNNVPFLIELLNRTKVPITWATVGHMFLDHCERGPDGRAHPEMPRPPRNPLFDGDWYLHDPCTNVNKAPGFYGPDLIRSILKSEVPHEFGTHSFSHIDFSQETSTPELVEAELAACAAAMQPFGIKPRSLVFCFNRPGYQHLGSLFKAGITSVRHRDAKVRLAYPERTPFGVYKLYESMNLRLSHRYEYFEKAKIFIDEAGKRGAAYHLWFHPSDSPAVFEQAFKPIVEYLAAQRERNRVWICTMSELAAYCEARRTTEVAMEAQLRAVRLRLSTTYDARQYGETDLTLVFPCPQRPRSVSVRPPGGGEPVAHTGYSFSEGDKTLILTIPCRESSIEVQLNK